MPPWVRHQFPEAGCWCGACVIPPAMTRPAPGAASDTTPERNLLAGSVLAEFPPRARWRGWPSVAAGHRRSRHARRASAGDTAHRSRQVTVLPDPGPVPLRQDRRADRRDLAAGGVDGRSGRQGSRRAGIRLAPRSMACYPCPNAPTCWTGCGLGDIAILIVSPEQLRNRAFARRSRSARSAPGCSMRRIAFPSGGTTSGPITAMSGVSSGKRQETGRCRRCCALPPPPSRTSWRKSSAYFRDKVGVELSSSTAAPSGPTWNLTSCPPRRRTS